MRLHPSSDGHGQEKQRLFGHGKNIGGGARNIGRVHIASAFSLGHWSGPSSWSVGWGKGSFLGVIVSCMAVWRHFMGVIGIWVEKLLVHLTANVISDTACRHGEALNRR